MIRLARLLTSSIVLVLCSCGGGNQPAPTGESQTLPSPASAQTLRAACGSSPLPACVLLPGTATVLAAVDATPTLAEAFAWAEATYPEFFAPGSQATLTSGPYEYRYYPQTQNYLGFAGQSIYVLGPMSGGELKYIGELSAFTCLIAPALCSGTTITGVAASGAAFVGAVVSVSDSTGTNVGTSAPVRADGKYSVTVVAGATAPFVLVALRTTADGEVQSLVGVLESTTTTTANITPVTTLIASLLSASGDPSKLAAEAAAGTVTLNTSTVGAAVSKVQASLASLLSATGTASTDPLTGAFVVDGTGYDRLLDSIDVTIVPTDRGASDIQIAVKQTLAEGSQPLAINFASTATTIPSLPAVVPESLVASGTTARIAAFLDQLTACYALPLSDRIVAGGATAADITAAACRSAFIGNDPSGFLHNGSVVGRGSAFAFLFESAGTGLQFSQGTYELSRPNGDLVIGYKVTDPAGDETFDTFVVRLDSDAKLKLVGNQYAYPGGIVPWHQLREFITLGQGRYSYRSTGYVPNVDNRTDASGQPIFSKVEVVSPDGVSYTLKPLAASSKLRLVKGTTTTGTDFIRIRSEFADSTVVGDFVTMDPGLVFAAVPYTELQVAALPSHATWTFRYFLAANAGSTPDAVQTYATRARALTIAELRQRQFAQLGASAVASMQAQANSKGQVVIAANSAFDLGDPAAGGGWTVPGSALPPTQVTLFGRQNGAAFDDTVSFGSTLRTATVTCSKATASDLHCGAAAGTYAAGDVGVGVHLWSRDSQSREFSHHYATYALTLP
jgi:hypothetical protein